jgi:choline-glycine betaine transporter
VLLVAPIIGFVLIMILFKVAALALHKKVDGYYKYKANDNRTIALRTSELARGHPLGVANGVIISLALVTLIYSISYFTVQIATGSDELLGIANHQSSLRRHGEHGVPTKPPRVFSPRASSTTTVSTW